MPRKCRWKGASDALVGTRVGRDNREEPAAGMAQGSSGFVLRAKTISARACHVMQHPLPPCTGRSYPIQRMSIDTCPNVHFWSRLHISARHRHIGPRHASLDRGACFPEIAQRSSLPAAVIVSPCVGRRAGGGLTPMLRWLPRSCNAFLRVGRPLFGDDVASVASMPGPAWANRSRFFWR